MNVPMLKVRGKTSTTLYFVFASWLAITVMFLCKGTAADITAYGIAAAAILVPWLQREWTEKVSVPKNGGTS
jgi:hypothetical protein